MTVSRHDQHGSDEHATDEADETVERDAGEMRRSFDELMSQAMAGERLPGLRRHTVGREPITPSR